MLGFGRFELQPERRRLLQDGEPVAIGARAFDVLLALAERRERVVTKAELLDLVWPGLVVEENNLQVQVSTLRKLLGPQTIVTIPGRGYRFTAPLDGTAEHDSNADEPSTMPAKVVDADTAPLTNLPRELPPLYGREPDLRALRPLILAHKLVTVVGTGGIGKSRLAQAAAYELRGLGDREVWMIDLSSVADPSSLPAAVAQVLGLSLPGRKAPQDEVVDALCRRALLLVLDGCEHLVEAVSRLVAALIERAPRVNVLATTQELLKVKGERLFRLTTLAVPTTLDVTTARTFGAVALLVDRVSALQVDFAVTEQNVADVVDICRRLDGLPLAIELAAARVPLLGVSGVRERLHERFRMLTGGARTSLRRHQTLRETLEWSHGLLSPEERAVFRRAGVFAGSFTMSAAQRALADGEMDEWAVLDHLGALVDKSLLVAEAKEPTRYRLLESSRAYALEKLREAGEADAVFHRHAQAMLALFNLSEIQRWTVPLTIWRELCVPDIDNLRAALDWTAQADFGLHLGLVGASAWIWPSIGQRVEGLCRCDRALASMDATTPPALEARLQLACCTLAEGSARAAKIAAAKRAVALYRQLGDQLSLFRALSELTVTLALSGDPEAGEQVSLEMAQLVDSAWPPQTRLCLLFARVHVLLISGRHDEGQVVIEEMFCLATALRDSRWTNEAQRALAESATIRGDFEEAVTRGRELVAFALHDRFGSGAAAWHRGNLSRVLTLVGQLDEALVNARDAAPVLAHEGTLWLKLDSIALLAFMRGRIAEAGMALGRAEAANVWRGGRRELSDQRVRDQVASRLQQALLKSELDRLLALGAAMSDEEVAQIALAD